MAYKLRTAEGLRQRIRQTVAQLPQVVFDEWIARMKALCANPALATPLRDGYGIIPVVLGQNALGYSFRFRGWVFIFALDIHHDEGTIDLLDFWVAREL